jgi:hypothetical protein
MTQMLLVSSLLVVSPPCLIVLSQQGMEKVVYLRPAGQQHLTECVFTVERDSKGWRIESVTQRGKGKMTVSAQYDERDTLGSVDASWLLDGQKKLVTVRVEGDKATVQREGTKAQPFDVPKGVIVTSAPDWTDTFLLCRRYDRLKGGKQSFPGLWIHPEQPSQRLTFAIERHDNITIDHKGEKRKLDRFTI